MDISKLQQVAKRPEQPLSTAPARSNALEILKQPSTQVIENGVNALALIDSPPMTTATFQVAVAKLQANYGTEYSPEKIALLFDRIRSHGWSESRFLKTFNWFLENKPYAAWTISDWFAFTIPVYPYEWYLKQCREGEDVSKQMDRYLLPNGQVVYRWKDGQELPLEKAPPLTRRMG